MQILVIWVPTFETPNKATGNANSGYIYADSEDSEYAYIEHKDVTTNIKNRANEDVPKAELNINISLSDAGTEIQSQ